MIKYDRDEWPTGIEGNAGYVQSQPTSADGQPDQDRRLSSVLRRQRDLLLKGGMVIVGAAGILRGGYGVGVGICSHYDACRQAIEYPASQEPTQPSDILKAFTFGIIGSAVFHRSLYMRKDRK